MIKIEKGIPIPSKQERHEIVETVLQMKPGDSVVVRDRDEAQKFKNAMQNRGLRYTTKKQPDGTVRVWHSGFLSGDPP